MRVQLLLLVSVLSTRGDIYLHNPRGSNNRLDDKGRARTNANRLFDSQNNNRGGYNVGSLYYYVGSKLPIEWTNQHSCGSPNNHCEIIIQYMCDATVRDGSITTTIPDNFINCENNDCNTDTRYGMHENYDYYANCRQRQRNMGLYLANQRPRGNTAKYTRQNRRGTRRAYECPEERDYYPYWHPTPWKDIAVMTNNVTRCSFYQQESQNVKDRWECRLPRELVMGRNPGLVIPITQEECESFRWPKNSENGTRARWVVVPSHNIPPPDCRETEFSRDNHLGNGIGGNPNVYNWTVPDDVHERCVLRIRYNISTSDYDAWGGINSTSNFFNRRTRYSIAERYGFPSDGDAQSRGYLFTTNPQLVVFPELTNLKFRLALDTAQYGRTFQDRSHTFAIRARPANLASAVIYNVNVRGKRGNIVQVYPAVEYDYVPNTLRLGVGDYVHFQWTGSNSNPQNNDGQGRAGTDRSNVILLRQQAYPEGTPAGLTAPGVKFGHWGRSYPETVSNTTFLGLSQQDLMDLALLTSQQFRGDMSELDDAGTYFDLGPRRVTKPGVFHYFCTRNNNFSNRSQKGRIICSEGQVASQSIGRNGGNLLVRSGDKQAQVKVEKDTFDQLRHIQVEQWSEETAEQVMKERQRKNPVGGSYSSLFTVIRPETRLTTGDKRFQVTMSVDDSGATVYRTSTAFTTWSKVEAQVADGVARFSTDEGGVFIAVKHTNPGMIAGIVVGVLVLVGVLVGGTVLYAKRQPGVFNRFLNSFRKQI